MKIISDASLDPLAAPVVIIDRINTMRGHREDVFGCLRTIGIRVVLVWESGADDCLLRIKSRGYGHRTIGPDDNAKMILNRTVKEFDPLSPDEMEQYEIAKVITIPEGLSREEVLTTILSGLRSIAGLDHLDLDSISSEEISRAIKYSTKLESKLVDENEAKVVVKTKPMALVREGRYELVIRGNISFLNSLFQSFNTNPQFVLKQHFHVTLLFINTRLARSLNDRDSCKDHSLNAYMSALKKYRQLSRMNLLVRPVYVAKNDRVMALKVEFMDQHSDTPFFDVVPHISIAKIPSAEFREANHLIEDCDTFRKDGLPNGTNGVHWMDIDDRRTLSGNIQFKSHGQP